MATMTLFLTGADKNDAIDHGLVWDDLASAKEFADETGDQRVFRFEVPIDALAVTEVVHHTKDETAELAERIPAGLRAPELDASILFYGIE